MKRTAVTTLAIMSILTTACGSSTSTAKAPDTTATSAATAGASSVHNAADVTFATGMIPHHAQAIEMAKLAPTRTTNEQVLDLAKRIEAAQGPEIAQLTAWLTEWGYPAPTTDPAATMDHSTMDHSAMGGMMTEAQMTTLEASSGADFDKLFSTMMIAHHEGAIAMAKTVLSDGENPDVKTMAQAIITSQQAEIDEMKTIAG